MKRNYRLEFIKYKPSLQPELIDTWKTLLQNSDSRLKIQQSPEWFKALSSEKDKASIFILYDENNEVHGIVPITLKSHKIKFDVKAKTFLSYSVNLVNILGSQPILPNKKQIYDLLIQKIEASFPGIDGIYFDSLCEDDFIWPFLSSNNMVLKNYFSHVPEGQRNHYELRLPPTFEEYLGALKKKRRVDFKKRLSRYVENNAGELGLVKIDDESQVSMFLASASKVSASSWQQSKLGNRVKTDSEYIARLKALARDGLLRAYLLYFNDKPCAFRLGYQLNKTYYSVETGYSQNYSDIAPGKILTLMMIKDFLANKPIGLVDFGVGESQWKRDFCNGSRTDASVFLLKKKPSLWLAAKFQNIFYALLESIKRLLNKNK